MTTDNTQTEPTRLA